MPLSKITANSISANAVTSAAIANGEIVMADLATNSVGTNQIQANAITGDKLALTAINANNIADGTITSPKIASNISLTGTIEVKGTSTQSGEIRLYEDTDNGTTQVTLKANNNIASNVVFTLPATDGTNGQFLRTNGSGGLSFASAGGSILAQVFTANGTFTVPSSGSFKVTVVGAGGSGRVVGSTGGFGGACCIKWFTGISSGTTCNVTVGQGGAGLPGNSGNVNGNDGRLSQFSIPSGTTLTANGGLGGRTGEPNSASASGGDINIEGARALQQLPWRNQESVTLGIGGASSLFGAGGAGGYVSENGETNYSGKSGTGFGSGGGGSGYNGGVYSASGAGANGIVIIEYVG